MNHHDHADSADSDRLYVVTPTAGGGRKELEREREGGRGREREGEGQGEGMGSGRGVRVGCKVRVITALFRQLVVLVVSSSVLRRSPARTVCTGRNAHTPAQPRDWLQTCTPSARRWAERSPAGPAQLACAATCCPRRFERSCRSKFAPRCQHWRAQSHILSPELNTPPGLLARGSMCEGKREKERERERERTTN